MISADNQTSNKSFKSEFKGNKQSSSKPAVSYHIIKKTLKLACCWLAAAAAVLTGPGVELAAVMTPPVILNVVVPGLDKCPAAASVLTEPSDSFICAPCEPTTCATVHMKQ